MRIRICVRIVVGLRGSELELGSSQVGARWMSHSSWVRVGLELGPRPGLLGQGLDWNQCLGHASRLELRTRRFGSLHAPGLQHQVVAVVHHRSQMWVQVGRQRLPAADHARQLPADEAAPSRQEGHHLGTNARKASE